MCKYCEINITNEAKRNIRKNQRVTIKIVRNVCNENLYYLSVDTNSYKKEVIDINYCPICRREARKVIQRIIDTIENLIEAFKEKDIKFGAVNALELAEKAGSSKCANTVMLGALCRILNEPEEKMLDIVSGLVPPKTVEMNKSAFKLGYERGQN